jgi:hypothetical protein
LRGEGGVRVNPIKGKAREKTFVDNSKGICVKIKKKR